MKNITIIETPLLGLAAAAIFIVGYNLSKVLFKPKTTVESGNATVVSPLNIDLIDRTTEEPNLKVVLGVEVSVQSIHGTVLEMTAPIGAPHEDYSKQCKPAE